MTSQHSSAGIVKQLAKIVGTENTISDARSLEDYKRDMADYEGTPMAVVRPGSEQETVQIVKLARRRRVPLVARGAGSSLTGAVVLEDGITIDMSRFNHVLKIDPINWYVHLQAGVVLDDLNKELEKHGFFFPPDPASSFMCTVGGAIAEGSGGMRCVKYGTMKDWVLSVRVVLPNGRIATFGEPLPKNRAGYDLVHLLTGSEGTLAIVTEAWLKILPIPIAPVRRMLVLFDDWVSAGHAIQQFRVSRIIPRLMEFMDRGTVAAVNRALELNLEEAEATLLVDIEESNGHSVDLAVKTLESSGARRIILAKDEDEADRFYQARAWAYIAVKKLATGVQVEDVVVPIDRLVEYLQLVQDVARRFNVRILVAGHAGDGNVHPTILYDMANQASRSAAAAAFEEICRYAIRVGGTVTGEHGVGVQKVGLFREQLIAHGGREALRLMKGIKRLFDPEGIMNPRKYVEAA